MKKLTRVIGVVAFCFVAMMGMSNVSSAATVGEKLTSAENGWQRIDDRNSNIEYIGSDWIKKESTYYSNQTISYSSSEDKEIRFKFKGTKIRLLSNKSTSRSVNYITIDGVEETYSELSTTDQYQIITYEKTGLVDGIHTVKITNSDSGKFLVLDAIDMDDTGYLVGSLNLTAMSGNNNVTLKWDKASNATEYIVKYGTASGKYTESKTVLTNEYKDNYSINNLNNGTTYYFTVSAMVNGIEEKVSNEASATPQSVSDYEGNSAILEIVMTNGTIKEYSLTADELDIFLTWYDNRSDGIGKSYYRIPKKSNVKPFLSRKEYLSFDKIYSFEVKDYNE
ncbi:MAG: fibronectin type III domain-containing protein [Velocimicrobium sp.]